MHRIRTYEKRLYGIMSAAFFGLAILSLIPMIAIRSFGYSVAGNAILGTFFLILSRKEILPFSGKLAEQPKDDISERGRW